MFEYLGKAFEAVVQLEDAPAAQLLVQSSRQLHPGESVEFAIRAERLLFYRDDAVGSDEQIVRQGAATSSSLAAQGAR